MWRQHYSSLILLTVFAYVALLSVLCSSDSPTDCIECVAGHFADPNISDCSSCNATGYCDTEADCTPCQPGFNQSRSGNDSCYGCPVGTYANETGSVNCTLCEKGHYNRFTKQRECLPCPVGYNRSTEGATNCTACQRGTFANSTGTIFCTPCAKGSHSNVSHAQNCTECTPGTYAKEEGMLLCMECKSGNVCNDTGCVECTECEAGTASNQRRTECDICGVGTYSKAGSVKCTHCEEGLICNHTGCNECWPCPPGEQPKHGTSTSCEECPAGTHRPPVTKMLTCAPCEKGYYQTKPGAFDCNECPGGYYCPDPASRPQPCPDGAHCPNGTAQPIFCHNLFTYSEKRKGCIPHTTFYVMVACVTAFVLMLTFLLVCVIYRNSCSRKKRVEDKVPLLPRGPVKNPTYTGL